MTRQYRARHLEALDRAIQILKMGIIYPHSDDPVHVKVLEKLRNKIFNRLVRSRNTREKKQNEKINPQ